MLSLSVPAPPRQPVLRCRYRGGRPISSCIFSSSACALRDAGVCVSRTANSIIVITGASSGIGKELALQYARRSCRLVLAARQAAALNEVAAQCQKLGSQCIAVPTDVTKEEDCKYATCFIGGVVGLHPHRSSLLSRPLPMSV